MHSISHALASADAIASFIDSEIRRDDNKVGNAQEASESKAAKAHAVSALKSMTSLIDGTLAKLRSSKASGGSKATVARSALAAARLARANSLPSSAQSLIKSLSSDDKEGLGSQNQSLQDMANAIEPIVDRFNDVLSKPYLDQFSATLDSVPVVGLKNNQIVYLATQLDESAQTGVQDVWKLFCSPPTDADVSDPNKVHFFPFNGNFCMSVGTAVWRKKHRTQDDPILKQAVDNWPKMYVDEWEKIGDNALPAADLRSIIPFAKLDATHNVIAFHLLILTQDGTIQVLTKDDIYAENSWATISYKAGSGGPSQAPSWTRMAYWDNSVAAVDDENNLWTVAVDFDGSTYSMSDESSIPSVSELTATDVGPVTVQSDGYLYRRYVQSPPAGESEPVQEWTQWVRQDGVTRLGVASPGVMLDLQTLTQSLKARYITTQTALYPVVNKFHAFAVTHQAYLTQLSTAASQYAEASTGEQQSLALQNGKTFVDHALVWAKILNQGIGDTKETVNVMTQQLDLVKTQLAIQLQVLKDKLTGLQRTLDTQEEELDKLKAAFWGALAAMFLGLVLGVVALFTGVGAAGLIGCGGLFAAGLVSLAALSAKIAQLNDQIAATKSQIDATTTAIAELTYVSNNFTDLQSMYGTLNQFWGRMYNDTTDLQTMDDATATQIGMQILLDTSSIVAAQGTTAELVDAAQLYLDTLNKQGIQIPDGNGASRALVRDGNEAEVRKLPPQEMHHVLQATVAQGRARLSNGDFEGYKKHMNRARSLQLLQTAATKDGALRSGLWFDVPALSGAASVFQGIAAQKKQQQVTNSLGDVTAADVDNQIRIAGPAVVGMLNKTNGTCQTAQTLIEKYKALSQAGDDAGIAGLKDTLLQEAIKDCESASSYAAEANNAFVDANHTATAYQEGLEHQVNQLRADENVKTAEIRRNIQEIQSSLWNNSEMRNIQLLQLGLLQANLLNISAPFEGKIWNLDCLEQSGVIFQNRSLTWTDMVQTVSSNLGGIYNILAGVLGQVMEDPTRYNELLQVEWATLQQNATDVLSILEAQGVPTKSVSRAIRKAVGRNIAAVSEGSGHDLVVEALCASPDVAARVTKQAEEADKFFSNMQALVQLPYLSTIIGYWDEEQADKTTLLDVVTRLRTQYVNMASSEYSAIEKLRVMALLQKTGAGLVAQGKESLDVFVNASSRNVNAAQQAAQETSAKFKGAASEYQAVLQLIHVNMDQIKQKITDVDVDISKLEEEERKKIMQVIADVIALAFATATLLASLGVFGPVEGALTTASALGLGAKETAAAVKTALDSASIADIAQAISRLQAVKRDLDSSLNSLEAVEPLFAATVDGVVLLESETTEAAEGLTNLLGSSAQWEHVILTEADAGQIGDSWGAVYEACTQWLDVINKQGISPGR